MTYKFSELIELIRNGKIEDAIVFFRATFPLLTMYYDNGSSSNTDNCSLCDSFKQKLPLSGFDCYFILLLQQLVELIRSKELARALEWIEAELVPLASSSSLTKYWLNDALGLLAYTNPMESPLCGLLDPSRWAALAEHLNRAICLKSTTFSPLELTLKQIIALNTLVHECNVFVNDEPGAKQWNSFNRLLTETNFHAPVSNEKIIKQD